MSGLRVQQYFGPSSRHDRACIEFRFAVGPEAFRLAPLEPALIEAGFKLREPLPEEAMPLEQAVARLAVELLARHARWWSSHGRDDTGGWAAIAHPYPQLAALALELAFTLLRQGGALAPASHARLRELSRQLEQVSKIKMWMLFAAEACGHGATMVSEIADIHQVGEGAKGVHLCRAGSQYDGLTSVRLESNKQATVDTLRKLGLPTTRGAVAHSGPQAVEIARKLGLPCVVKPLTLSRGTGVAANLTSAAAVQEAALAALKLSPDPIRVEKHVEGDTHRLLVAADELLWVYRKRAARVTGDGKTTLTALIERENDRRARNRDRAEAHLVRIEQDEALRRYVRDRHGLGPDDVVPKDKVVDVSGQANTASGGTLEDMLSVTHPDNRALAIRVARLFRFNVTGIDMITPDITRSWKELPCAILEVNRMPSMNALGDATLVQRTMFPNRLSALIPTVAVVGDKAFCAEHAEVLRDAFAHHGLRVAAAGHRAKYVANSVLPGATPLPLEALMLDPEADVAVALCDPALVDRAGLPLRRCDLLIRQDKAAVPWLDGLAETVLRGSPTQARIDLAALRLARRYGDRVEGGPVPVLEPLDGPADAFRLKVWRVRGTPRTWFWGELGIEPPRGDGLATCEDLLQAVAALVPGLAGGFVHDELPGGWALVNFEATLALPDERREETRAALLAAVEQVNAVAAKKVP